MNTLKMYKIYIGNILFLILNIVGPATIIIMGNAFQKMFPGYMTAACGLIIFEIVIDSFCSNSIYYKGNKLYDYIKSSYNGRSFLKRSFDGDIVLRLIRLAVVFILSSVSLFIKHGLNMKILAAIMRYYFLSAVIIFVIINITRHFDNFNLSICLGGIGSVCVIALGTVLGRINSNIESLIMFFLILILLRMIYITKKNINNKIDDLYFDEVEK
jgi:hypothetical protein